MAEIENFEGDMFWNSDDTESACYSPEEELENVVEGDIIEFEQARRLPNFFGVTVDGKDRYFDTLEEAVTASTTPQPEASEEERKMAGE